MAKKPRDPVQFTYESAERIAGVVRAAELSSPSTAPLKFRRLTDLAKQVKSATFTGPWPAGTLKAVTLANSGGITANALNLTMVLPFSHTLNCVIAKQAGGWVLVDAQDEPVQRGTFSGSWSKGSVKTVTLYSGGTMPAVNPFVDISGTGLKECTIARDGSGAWHLIATEC